jgi:hypothetical protein
MMALAIKNLMQVAFFKNNPIWNYIQMILFFLLASVYAFLKPLQVNIMPYLIIVTVFIFILFVIEAIALGGLRTAYRIKLQEAEETQKKQNENVTHKKKFKPALPPVPKELKLAWFTFFLNLLAFLVAGLQLLGIFNRLFPGAFG